MGPPYLFVFTVRLLQMLKDFAFYHGYLPREDLKELLRSPHDYLLRISEVRARRMEIHYKQSA